MLCNKCVKRGVKFVAESDKPVEPEKQEER